MQNNEEKRTTSDWVPRDESPGRRGTDRNQCAMHDYLQNKNDHCFDLIKQTIREEVQKRDHKFEVFEERLENFISKWALGIIIAVSLSLFGGMFGFAVWQMKELKSDITRLSDKMVGMNTILTNSIGTLNNKMVTIGIKQEGIIRELEKLAPEHKMLMQHLIDFEKSEKAKE